MQFCKILVRFFVSEIDSFVSGPNIVRLIIIHHALSKPIHSERKRHCYGSRLKYLVSIFVRVVSYPFLYPATVAPQTQTVTPREDEYLFVKSGRALQKILLKDILYFEGEKEYVHVVTPVHKLLVYRRLKDIEEQLSASFARVHNSYIVNIARLESIRDNQIFVGGKQIPISEKFREAFMNRIKERVF